MLQMMERINNKWAIDGTVLQWQESLFFIWSGWEGDVNVEQRLYIAPMKNPYSIEGERVYIIYSASGSWTDDYKLGMIYAELCSNLLDPSSKKKRTKNRWFVFSTSRYTIS